MQKDTVSCRQFVAVIFVTVLAPLIRRFPRVLTETAGRSAWLSVPIAVLPLLLGILVAYLLLRGRGGAPQGFADVLTDVFGRVLGRGITALYALWFLFYAGFLLRSGADRFISTIYPGAGIWIFVLITAALCLPAAMGCFRSLARVSMLFRPLMVAVFVIVFALTIKDIDFGLLLPVGVDDILPNCGAALKTANMLSVAAYLAFLGDKVERPFAIRDWAGWAATLLAIVGLMAVCCIGMFGPALTSELTFPFFMLARDVTVLGSLERVEPVVIALWVFSDFILVALLLMLSARNLRFCFFPAAAEPPKARWLLPVCTVVSVVTAFVISDASAFELFSEKAVPAANAVMVCVPPLLTLLVGKLRHRL